jgi:hypothetical protein
MLKDTLRAVAESGGDLLVNYPPVERLPGIADPEASSATSPTKDVGRGATLRSPSGIDVRRPRRQHRHAPADDRVYGLARCRREPLTHESTPY